MRKLLLLVAIAVAVVSSVPAQSPNELPTDIDRVERLLDDRALEKQADWTVSEPDLKLALREVQKGKGDHKFTTSRRYDGDAERAMIEVAEAIFPKSAFAARSDENQSDAGKSDSGFHAPVELAPYWSLRADGDYRSVMTISKRAIEYYQQLSNFYRDTEKLKPDELWITTFKYSADVEFSKSIEFAGEKFENVFVVTLKLSWSQYCGALCAAGFARTKIVIFDKQRKPIAVFMSRPVDWVS